MSQAKNLVTKETTIGDAAVDGLLGGLGAGIVMAIYLAATGLAIGDSPAVLLSRFDPGVTASPLTGALMHLAVAGVYGMVFSVGYHFVHPRRLPAWLVGLAYGLALLVLAEAIILPGANSPLSALPPWAFASAHVAYGVTLGVLVSRAGANLN